MEKVDIINERELVIAEIFKRVNSCDSTICTFHHSITFNPCFGSEKELSKKDLRRWRSNDFWSSALADACLKQALSSPFARQMTFSIFKHKGSSGLFLMIEMTQKHPKICEDIFALKMVKSTVDHEIDANKLLFYKKYEGKLNTDESIDCMLSEMAEIIYKVLGDLFCSSSIEFTVNMKRNYRGIVRISIILNHQGMTNTVETKVTI